MTSQWATLRSLGISALLSVACSSSAWSQQATANHNVVLRRDPSTSSPAVEHLQKGDRLTLVDASPDSGFYHARTEDDQVGWVFARYVTISSTPPSPSPPPTDGCDARIATHVYHPDRLIVKQGCVSVTGTIVDATANQSTHRADG